MASGTERQKLARDWGERLTQFASVAAVAVTTLAVVYTNDANRHQAMLMEQGQITDRMTRAIDQLGSDRLEIRLGGIYSLERVMRDSPTDEAAVSQVLAGFVNDYAARHDSTSPPSIDRTVMLRPPTDVQAALTVIGRRADPAGRGRTPIDLAGTNLVRVNLDGASLSGAGFAHANLAAGHLVRTELNGADLRYAYLGRGSAKGSVPGAIAGVDLPGADLMESRLVHAIVTDASLIGACLVRADLTGADLARTNLAGVNLTRAKLRGANLSSAYLDGADLSNADLTKADLTEVDLTNVNLSAATLTDANLAGAKRNRVTGTGKQFIPLGSRC
jgi:uncharacterized protein YjbI with pentapeptide repeats